jgi:type I restriction enzyme S subunit
VVDPDAPAPIDLPQPGDWQDTLIGRWEIAPLRRFLRGIDQGWSPTAEDRRTEPEEWAVLKLSAVSRGTFRPEEHKALPPELDPVPGLEVREGDLLLTRANTPELVGDACVVPEVRPKLMMSDLIYRLRLDTDHLDPRFAQYWLLSSPGRDQIARDARGSSQSMVKISQQTVRSWLIPMPPLDEQRAIADYLDRKTAAIDALIARRERHIELLEEKRHAIVVERALRGIKPDTPIQDSGIRWMGDIPVHWPVVRIKYVARLESGHTPDRKVARYWADGSIPWVSLKDTKTLASADYISETLECTTPAGLANSSARLLPAGTVVFTRDATIGLAAIAARPMAVSQHLIGWVCGAELLPEYLLRVIDAMRDELDRLTFGATIRTIGMDDVKELDAPIPPVEEQRAIVNAIRTELERHDVLRARLQEQIARLREYRQTLISAAVTGQLPVREEVPA